MYELTGILDSGDCVRTTEPLEDEVCELERGEYEVPFLEDEDLKGLEIGDGDGYGGRGVEGKYGENDNGRAGGDGNCDK